MYIWLQFLIITGYIFFSGIMIGSPLRKNYSTARTATNILKYNSVDNLHYDTAKILSESKHRIYTGMLLDILGTHTLNTILILFSLVTMKTLFSNLYLNFPFYFPWFVIDFPPIGMVNRLGWISLSIIMSYIWSLSYARIRSSACTI